MRAVLAQSRVELALSLRRGESLVVSLAIPVGILVFFAKVEVVKTDLRDPVQFLVPGVLALAVMSSAMVSLGIATGYDISLTMLSLAAAVVITGCGLSLALSGKPAWCAQTPYGTAAVGGLSSEPCTLSTERTVMPSRPVKRSPGWKKFFGT